MVDDLGKKSQQNTHNLNDSKSKQNTHSISSEKASIRSSQNSKQENELIDENKIFDENEKFNLIIGNTIIRFKKWTTVILIFLFKTYTQTSNETKHLKITNPWDTNKWNSIRNFLLNNCKNIKTFYTNNSNNIDGFNDTANLFQLRDDDFLSYFIKNVYLILIIY